MLWFYLLVNVGGFFGVATAYLAKYVGFWSSYLLPTIIYLSMSPLHASHLIAPFNKP